MPNKYVIAGGVAGVVVLGLVIALLTGVFSGDSDPIVAASPTPSPSPLTDPTCPLTGEDPRSGVRLGRPAVAVKIEDSPQARPQSGLEHADIVFEEIVEGGITRFMAIFHCGGSEQAGPVRSARFDDPKIAKPFTRALVYSGANDIVEAELVRSKMVALDEDSGAPALFRVPPGVFEVHNLFVDTEKIRGRPDVRALPSPKEIFTFGPLEGRAKKARSVRVNFTASNTIEYKWEGQAWRRYEGQQPFFAATGEQVAVQNVLVMEVIVNNSTRVFDVVGNPSPDILLEGEGRAILFRDGRLVKGTWAIKSAGQPPSFSTRKGRPLVFAEGRTWIELVPSKTGDVKGSVAFGKK